MNQQYPPEINKLVQRVLMQDRTGKYPQMLNTCHEIIKLQPDIPEAHYFLGCAHMKLDQYQRAIEAFKEAVAQKSDYAEAHNNLGSCQFSLGQHQEATEAFLKAIDSKPDMAAAHFNLVQNVG